MIKAEDIDSTKQFFRLIPEGKIILIDNENNSEKKNQTIKHILESASRIIPNEDRSFLLFDLGAIMDQYDRMRILLPRVQPFFAIKCMADKTIVSFLGALGTGFDCASWDEIRQASMALEKPAGTFAEKYHSNNTERIIFSHPFKFENEMNAACKIGVEFTVFDTVEELRLISNSWPSAKLLLRIMPPKKYKAYAELGNKFGVESNMVAELIRVTRKLNLNLCGVSFHVGSGVEEMEAWLDCIKSSATVFQQMEEEDFRPYILDIGGGFPGVLDHPLDPVAYAEQQLEFESVCNRMNKLLDELFPVDQNYIIISEPGAYFMQGSGAIFTQIIGKTEVDPAQKQTSVTGTEYPAVEIEYVLNNSIYHSLEAGANFNLVSMKDYSRYGQILNLCSDYSEEKRVPSRLLGYTVDEHDLISEVMSLPSSLSVGDWLAAVDRGAYSDVHNDLSTVFCASTAAPHYYCISKSALTQLRTRLRHDQRPDQLLNSTDRDSVVYKITRNCLLM